MRKFLSTATLLVVLAALSGCANRIEGSQSPAQTGSQPSSESTPTESVDQTPTSGVTPGSYVVGETISAGTYRAEVMPPEGGDQFRCLVEQSDPEGIVTNNPSVEIKGSVIFAVPDIPGSHVRIGKGCVNIGFAHDMVRTNPELANGYYLVGDEIPAGEYICTIVAEPGQTYVSGAIKQTAADGELIDWTMAIEAGDLMMTVQDVPGSFVGFSNCSSVTRA